METNNPAPTEWTAASRTGAISVRTTEQGLPLGVTVDPAELRRNPHDLAHEMIRLCKQAANRAGMVRRAELEEAGMTSEMLDLLSLPTAEEVARQEISDEEEYETDPDSWLRQV